MLYHVVNILVSASAQIYENGALFLSLIHIYNEYTVPHGAGIPLIVYDPAQVDFEIKGYEDLWNPKLEDKIAMIGSYRAVNGFVLQTMGKSMNEEDVQVIEQAGEKLKELAPNIRMIQDSDCLLYTSRCV